MSGETARREPARDHHGARAVRAAVIRVAGGPFAVREVERRAPGPGEVAVRIRAAGICQTDLSLAAGGFGQRFPVVLGHEGAGEVLEVGQGVRRVEPGARVVLTWVPPCGHCYHCVRGETWICSGRRRSADAGDGLRTPEGDGVVAGMGTATFAEETVVPEAAVLPLPDDVPFEVAALLGCAVPTGLGAALNAAGVRPGETVLVIGCGAVGLSAIQGARIAGASMIVGVDPQAARRERASTLGASRVIAPDEPARVLVDPAGFDVAIDAVGRATTIRAAWDATRRGGRVVVVGAGRSDDPVAFSALELFHEEKSLRGTFYGSGDMVAEVPRMIALWRSGALDVAGLIDGTAALDGIEDAAARQRSGEALRIVVVP